MCNAELKDKIREQAAKEVDEWIAYNPAFEDLRDETIELAVKETLSNIEWYGDSLIKTHEDLKREVNHVVYRLMIPYDDIA